MGGRSVDNENFADWVKRLNSETNVEAERWFRENRKIRLPIVFWNMLRNFVKTYFFEGGWRDGFFGFMRAANGSLYQLISYSKYWEFKERERGRM